MAMAVELLKLRRSSHYGRDSSSSTMETACGAQWLGLRPYSSHLGRLGCSTSGSSGMSTSRGDVAGWSSRGSECFGVRAGSRFLDCVTVRTAVRDAQRVGVIASSERPEESWKPLVTKAGLALLAGTFLPEASARAESAADFLLDIAGGNLNNLIIYACIGQAIALTGAVVGGVMARQRRDELERINNQLRQINTSLRRQARVESYAPSLTYAPVGGRSSVMVAEPIDRQRDNLMQLLKSGKRLLREQSPAQAFVEFEEALGLARQVKDTVEEKKAARGMGAACQRQGKYKEAIKYHSMVLAISQRINEHSGNTEAYGAIADCYTELGDLELAAKYYDRYIERLENEDVD